MNRLLLCLLILAGLAATNALTAQDRFSIGPRAGVNFSKFVGESVETDATSRVVLGLTSTYSINERTGLTVDLLYSGEGFENGTNENNELHSSYLRLPVLYDYFFRGQENDFRPKIYAGIAPGFLLDAEQGDNKLTDRYNRLDVSGVVGGGFNYRIAPSGVWLNTDVRYHRGLIDVYDDNVGNTGDNVYNSGWQVSLGVAFGL